MADETRIKTQKRIRAQRYRSLKKLRVEECINQPDQPNQPSLEEEKSEVMCASSSSSDESNEKADKIISTHLQNNLQSDQNNDFCNSKIQYDAEADQSLQQNEIFEDDLHKYYYEFHDSSDEDFNDSSDNNDDEEDEEDKESELNAPQQSEPQIITQLREWGTRIKQKDLDDLLIILRKDLLPTLPKCAKTFLRTASADYKIIKMDDAKGGVGEFVCFSIAKALQDTVNPELHNDKHIKLQVSADGIPLKRSSDEQFWVLSGKIHFEPDIYQVFAICIFYGKAKPKTAELFLNQFILQLNELLADGLFIKGHKFTVELKCFICDTPARAFLKFILGHNGIEACERCEVEGKSVQRRTVYPDVNAVERTDASFRSQKQSRHHNGPSPLLKVVPPIDLIFIFILDFMHLFCCGIIKKLLDYWTSGQSEVRLDVKGRLELGRRMEHLRSQIPFEFQRKTRTTGNVGKWKATEFRFFLLYCGPLVLRKLLKDDLYKHFLLLHVAARILCSESTCHIYNDEAKSYLRAFFEAMGHYYGESSQILNAHHLIHVADDVKSMNCNLSLITAFAFENFLGKLKRLLRTPNRQLAQVCRRLHEKQTIIAEKKVTIPPILEILQTNGDNDVTKFRYKEFTFSNSSPNNMVLLDDGSIASIERMFKDNYIWKLECLFWKTRKPLFTYPTDSSKLNIWKLENVPYPNLKIRPLTCIKCKLVRLQLSFEENSAEKLYVTPFLH